MRTTLPRVLALAAVAALAPGGTLRAEKDRARFVVQALVDHLCAHPDELAPGDDLCDRVVDQVAGMTDRFAIRRFQELYVPRAWTEP